MIPAQVIASKRDGLELTEDEIAWFIREYANERIPEYQMSALAMAIFLQGMTPAEVRMLTLAMLESGCRLQWPEDDVLRVDKHSTGGVGDKVSVILAPLLAECGLQVPMLSGRGLGPTGGTLDKLEAIPGFRTDLQLSEITRMAQDVGCIITGTTAELAPADRKLYALRDVTATVPSIPLITASILSKKLAESLDALVLDVKVGNGSFMRTEELSTTLARSLVAVGKSLGMKTTALLTDMNQPLGRMCGNAVEINESLDVLRGEGPSDVVEVTLALAAELLVTTDRAADRSTAIEVLSSKLNDGSALGRFHKMVRAQGGDPDAKLTVAPAVDVLATRAGHVTAVSTAAIGQLIIAMGGGRKALGESIDHSVGVDMMVKIGERVDERQPMARLFHRSADQFVDRMRDTISISDEPSEPAAVVRELLTH